MKYGFTGTRIGMTRAQIEAFETFISELDVFTEFHHGDCVGADDDAADIVSDALENSDPEMRNVSIVVHPPINDAHRAYNGGHDADREPKTYFARNRDIVNETDVLVAAPCDMTDQPKGGTWMTIHYAMKVGKPVIIIWPDGRVEHRPDNAKGASK